MLSVMDIEVDRKQWLHGTTKNRDKSKDTEKKRKDCKIKDLMKHHKGFVNAMSGYCFEIECKRSWGPDAKFDAKFVK